MGTLANLLYALLIGSVIGILYPGPWGLVVVVAAMATAPDFNN